jgi:hypothetical protein
MFGRRPKPGLADVLALPATAIPRRLRQMASGMQVLLIAKHLGGCDDPAATMDAYIDVLGFTPAQWLAIDPMTKVARHEHAMDRLFATQGVDRALATPEALLTALKNLTGPLLEDEAA